MKKNKYMIATLMILIGMGAIVVSCEKDRKVISKAEIKVNNSVQVRLGEDDEDPVIQGKVKKKHSLDLIEDAFVETISNATNNTVTSSYTDEEGEFKHQVPASIYYFRVTVPGEPYPFVTDTVHVSRDKDVTILIE